MFRLFGTLYVATTAAVALRPTNIFKGRHHMSQKRQQTLIKSFNVSRQSPPTQWECSACTFLNDVALNSCEMCDATSSRKKAKKEKQTHPFAEELNKKLQGDLFYLTDDAASWVIHKRKFKLPPSSNDFDSAWSSHPSSYHKLKVFGREVSENRYSQHWSSKHGEGYSYSGTRSVALCYKDGEIPGARAVEELTSCCNELTAGAGGGGERYNACLQNWYEQQHTIGLHADDERQMDPEMPIFSLSWGGTRRFLLRPKEKPTGEGVREFFLESGSLLVMGGTCQKTHKHEVPKFRKTKDPPTSRRINWTVRAFL
ncbi:hypothetical protein TrRE_jg6189 [Triparma retinervis]|uniref:Fe2OG dioxygenase domain-containing protein n=1 Tax=Triparma retinervis TaxID=2557542 RepID=A0A9W7G8K0_9STRA|nr:hypothetical protein TrRE_jg6189 [Triparma retinervis]